MKKIAVLGSTGSIGTQTASVMRNLGGTACALTTNRNAKLLAEQVREFGAELAVAYEEEAAKELKILLADLPVRVMTGMDGLLAAAAHPQAETVVTAVVGMVGLLPTLAAIDAGKDIALANKETLVCAGQIVMQRAREKQVAILPVDSEHSAIFQCLQARQENALHKIILTASGGPFFGYSDAQLASVTRAQALKHPNWSMGAKITIDSATMMNKGLELIEAMWLYDTAPEDIEVVVHRESIIHSLIEFEDASVLAQLGVPDMRIPIQYALTFPARMESGTKRLSLTEVKKLSFFEPDPWAAKAVSLARRAAAGRGNVGAAFNGANEEAVALFLEGAIAFSDIVPLVEQAMNRLPVIHDITLDDILETDRQARELVRGEI